MMSAAKDSSASSCTCTDTGIGTGTKLRSSWLHLRRAVIRYEMSTLQSHSWQHCRATRIKAEFPQGSRLSRLEGSHSIRLWQSQEGQRLGLTWKVLVCKGRNRTYNYYTQRGIRKKQTRSGKVTWRKPLPLFQAGFSATTALFIQVHPLPFSSRKTVHTWRGISTGFINLLYFEVLDT